MANTINERYILYYSTNDGGASRELMEYVAAYDSELDGKVACISTDRRGRLPHAVTETPTIVDRSENPPFFVTGEDCYALVDSLVGIVRNIVSEDVDGEFATLQQKGFSIRQKKQELEQLKPDDTGSVDAKMKTWEQSREGEIAKFQKIWEKQGPVQPGVKEKRVTEKVSTKSNVNSKLENDISRLQQSWEAETRFSQPTYKVKRTTGQISSNYEDERRKIDEMAGRRTSQ